MEEERTRKRKSDRARISWTSTELRAETGCKNHSSERKPAIAESWSFKRILL